MRSARASRSRPPRPNIFSPPRAVPFSDPDVRAGFAVRQIHVENIRIGNAFERREQISRSMFRAEPLARRLGDFLHFIQAANLLARNPQPSRCLPAFHTYRIALIQPLGDRLRNFRPQPSGLEIRLRHEKILREELLVRFERHDAAGERFQLLADRAGQALAAQRNFRPYRIAPLRSLATKIQRIRKQRRDPIALLAQMNALRRRALEPRPPITAARQNLNARICLVVRNASQDDRYTPRPQNRIVTDRRKKARARDIEVGVSPLLPVCSRVSLPELLCFIFAVFVRAGTISYHGPVRNSRTQFYVR